MQGNGLYEEECLSLEEVVSLYGGKSQAMHVNLFALGMSSRCSLLCLFNDSCFA